MRENIGTGSATPQPRPSTTIITTPTVTHTLRTTVRSRCQGRHPSPAWQGVQGPGPSAERAQKDEKKAPWPSGHFSAPARLSLFVPALSHFPRMWLFKELAEWRAREDEWALDGEMDKQCEIGHHASTRVGRLCLF